MSCSGPDDGGLKYGRLRPGALYGRAGLCAATAGFSLIELLIALAMVGILLGVAMPAYERQVLRVQRGIAALTLETLRTRQEQYFAR
ncbi:MAG: type IV pilin protein, partial [Parahaliea sp.]